MENISSIKKENEIINEDELFHFVELDETKSEHLSKEPYSYMKAVFRSFIKKPAAIIGIISFIVLILGIIIIPQFAYDGAYKHDISNINASISRAHLWGTDRIGRDLFFSTWKAAGYSLWLATISAIINLIIGILLGLVWGFFKKIDWLFIEIYNLISNIPSMLLYMLLSTIFIQAGSLPIEIRLIFTLTLTGWLGIARFVRNQTIIINDREYNIASKTLGTPARRMMTKNLLPYIMAVIVTSSMTLIPNMISSEVSLSYFGLGLPSDSVSLGALLDLGRRDFLQYPLPLLAPGILLALIIFTFFLIGIALSDALDPKTHR